MFTDTIEKQGSEEQKAEWLPLIKQFRMVGTYAQTEMGHGKTFIHVHCNNIDSCTKVKRGSYIIEPCIKTGPQRQQYS